MKDFRRFNHRLLFNKFKINVKMIQHIINKNVEFWVSQLNPQIANFKSGNDLVDVSSNIFQNKLRSCVEDTQIQLFKELLTKKLNVLFIEGVEKVRLSVDYEPQGVLLEVVEQSKINPFIFPCKSSTYIDFYNLTLKSKLGYGSPVMNIID